MKARLALAALALGVSVAAPAAARSPQESDAPVLIRWPDPASVRAEATRLPLFAQEMERAREDVDAAIRAGVHVPVPRDPGGGATHEQHKRNYKAIQDAGFLYRLTGEARYAEFARRMLLAYADLYPGLGPHPAAANQRPGRLFWQSLNDSVWLVHAAQGYDAIRQTLSEDDRRTIEGKVFRPMATFLSKGSPEVFDRIHNHATWANAAVGLSGYVLRDPDLVEKALLGLDKSGNSGILRQLDLLFSPDGYYAEGPYYQRYALLPFVLFAQAVEENDPQRRIFAHRDGVLLKAVHAAIQMTYQGHFFPINDAMPDKSLRTEELYAGVAIAYARTRDPGLLSIAQMQGRTILTAAGFAVARDLAAGRARPFPFRSILLRDGPEGERGALAVLRSGAGPDDQVVVAKNTAQGMGHGHFDKLNWLLYDNGNAIVTDYGAARFLNVEAKQGGRYLPENESWAKQTIAHNSLVVDETSHFGGEVERAEAHAPRQIHFEGEGDTRVSTAEMVGAYPDVRFRRSLVQLRVEGFSSPLVLDLLRVEGGAAHQYDLPLHFAGHIIETGFPLQSNPASRPVLGTANGYQHIWVDAIGAPTTADAFVTWINDGRFYTYRMLPAAGSQVILAESGANDPSFNLRREPMLIQRVRGSEDATFVSLLEPHGAYDPSAETTVGSRSRIGGLRHHRDAAADLVEIDLPGARTLVIAIADDPSPAAAHSVTFQGRPLAWRGHVGRFDIVRDATTDQDGMSMP
ncbi:alginate lyase family protein [Sphingosinicella sp. CPCC 101087]|uniref:alginate lyase family protein n=1 Tax=Sphingosinicella sp. CPCC 101087 TaxID=2497754 RepID=UPI00197D091B|nr:alginate lyase family protein [Sphingosinicella sp. CPCC 101087]